MTQVSDWPRYSQRVAIGLTVLVGVIATVVAYLGTWEAAQVPPTPPAGTADATLPVDSIVLPHVESELPGVPHERTFVNSCTICHSTRLVMTQPPFPQKQWAAVVHKMVKNYGAPITPEAEAQIVDYLASVRGQ